MEKRRKRAQGFSKRGKGGGRGLISRLSSKHKEKRRERERMPVTPLERESEKRVKKG